MPDVTLERLEAFEERASVELRGLFLEQTILEGSGSQFVSVRGELVPRDGDALPSDVDIVLTVYDLDGRVLGTASQPISAHAFFVFEAFEVIAQFSSSVSPTKARVYPKLG